MIKVNGKKIEFQTFPNGETKLIHETVLDALEKDETTGKYSSEKINVYFKYEGDADLIKLMFVGDYLRNQVICWSKSVLTIAYMPYSRMDRSEGDSAFTLEYVTGFINNLRFNKVILNEPHSNVSGFLIDNVEEKFITPLLAQDALVEFNFGKDDSIMFPDAGAKTRYKDVIKANHIIVGEKKRDFKTGRITGLKLVGDLEGAGYKALIIDDLSSYGGTFVKSAKELRKQGFKWIGLVVTHAENVIFEGELFDHIDALVTTDSILDTVGRFLPHEIEEKLIVYKMEELSL